MIQNDVSWTGEHFTRWATIAAMAGLVLLVGLSGCETTKAKEADPLPIEQAIKQGDMASVEAYTEDMSFFGPEVFGRKHLMLASSYGQTQIVQYMLKHGADPGPYVNKRLDSPLHFAAGGGHVETMRVLIEAGADVDALDNYGKRPLHWAAERNRPQAAVLLIERGADPNPWSNFGTPLQEAQERGHTQVVAVISQAIEEQKGP